MSDLETERYSLCIVSVDYSGYNPYYKYYRVADFYPEDDASELVPSLFREDFRDAAKGQLNPDYLYNPSAAKNHEIRDSDFILVRWRPDPQDLGRQRTLTKYDDNVRMPPFKGAREVILLEGLRGEKALRDALEEGIPFNGRTTPVFYIAYEEAGDDLYAIQCDRKRFRFEDGAISLRVGISNVRSTVLSAPKVRLQESEIIDSPHSDTGRRMIYASLDDIAAEGRVLLRHIDYYARDYVLWFLKDAAIDVTKTQRRELSKLIDAALKRPDALEAYLGAKPSDREVKSLKMAIASKLSEEGDDAKELVKTAVLEDADFRKQCVDQAKQEASATLAKENSEIAKARNELDSLKASIHESESKLSNIKGQRESLEQRISSLNEELSHLDDRREQIYSEVESNLALKLGLRSVITSAGPRSVAPATLASQPAPVTCVDTTKSMCEALGENMKRLGVTSISGDAREERALAATGIEAALSVTGILVIPQPVAIPVADALSACLYGKRADRIWVPADCRDAAPVLSAASANGSVLIVENLIDPVNEGLLSALLYGDTHSIVILPFLSHASIRLVAPEAWERAFLPPVESLIAIPCRAGKEGLLRLETAPSFSYPDLDDALEEARSIKGDLEALNVPDGIAAQAGAIALAAEEVGDTLSGTDCIAQHLALSMAYDPESIELLAPWAGPSAGFNALLERLGAHGY